VGPHQRARLVEGAAERVDLTVGADVAERHRHVPQQLRAVHPSERAPAHELAELGRAEAEQRHELRALPARRRREQRIGGHGSCIGRRVEGTHLLAAVAAEDHVLDERTELALLGSTSSC